MKRTPSLGSNCNEIINETQTKQERQEELDDVPDPKMKRSSLPVVPLSENTGLDSWDVKERKTEQMSILPITQPCPEVILSLVSFAKLGESSENENVATAESKIKLEELNDVSDPEMKPNPLPVVLPLSLENTGLDSWDMKEIQTEQKNVLPITEPCPEVILSLVSFEKFGALSENENVVTAESKIKLENSLIKHSNPLDSNCGEIIEDKKIKTENVLPITEPCPEVILSLVSFAKLGESSDNEHVVTAESKIKLENLLMKHSDPMDPDCKEIIGETKIKKEEINDWPQSEMKPGSIVPWKLEDIKEESLDVKNIKTELKCETLELSPEVKPILFPFVKLERKFEIENALGNGYDTKLQIKQELKDYKIRDIESKLTLEKSIELKDKLSLPTFYICENCDKCFEERNSLEKHKCSRTGSGNRRNSVRIIQKKTAKITRKKSQINVLDDKNLSGQKQEVKLLVCHYCKKTFNVKEDLVIHLRHHKENNYSKKKFLCNHCDRRFWHKVDLVKHPCMMPAVKNEKRKSFLCDICDTACRSAMGLEFHLQKHYFAEPGACKFCGKVFKTGCSLLVHENSHIGIKPFKCNYCDKHFGQRSHLTVHERIHKKSKPYSCRECGKFFSDKGNVKTHELTHSGARPYKCDKCGKKFTQKSHLNTHKALHKSERKYSCQVCGLSFKLRTILQSHVYLHMDEKPFNCRVCKKGFCQQTAFRIHSCNKDNDLL